MGTAFVQLQNEQDLITIAMMDADEFNRLAYSGKTEAILKGSFLAARLSGHYYIKLYNVETFYVEVFLTITVIITHFRAFQHTLFLSPYLDNLTIAV